MEIIFANRSDMYTQVGGDTTQLLKTKAYLEERYPITIHICLRPEDIANYPNAQILHVFNLETIKESLALIAEGRQQQKKIILSPIYWYSQHLKYVRFLFKTFKLMPTSAAYQWFNYKQAAFDWMRITGWNRHGNGLRKQAVMMSDYLLPNSPEELDVLHDTFGIDRHWLETRALVVPNAFERPEQFLDRDEIRLNLPDKPFVLQVGRFDCTKNQVGTLNALWHEPNLALVFIGRIEDPDYYQAFLKLAKRRPDTVIIPHLPPESLAAYYRAAQVHVLPSFKETTGLVTLEALSFGTQVVVSNQAFCPVQYYQFDRLAHLCNPFDPASIRRAVKQALAAPKPVVLTPNYFDQFSYARVSDLTFAVYESLLPGAG